MLWSGSPITCMMHKMTNLCLVHSDIVITVLVIYCEEKLQTHDKEVILIQTAGPAQTVFLQAEAAAAGHRDKERGQHRQQDRHQPQVCEDTAQHARLLHRAVGRRGQEVSDRKGWYYKSYFFFFTKHKHFIYQKFN